MTLNTGKIKYEVIREVISTDVNDVVICQNALDRKAAYKTVWIVKNRDIAKILIREFSKNDAGECEGFFSQRDYMCFVFPYIQERPLLRFYNGTCNAVVSRHQIWLDIVIQCMTRKLPQGVLNLIIKQGQINIASDGGISFGYSLDLSQYQANINEKENVTLCAQLILELIYQDDAKSKDTTVILLEKKLKRNKYVEFIHLFKDIKIIMQDNSDVKTIEKIKRYVVSRQDKIYRFLLGMCVVLVLIVGVYALGRIVLPDFSFWKIFTNSLSRIGTQSLLN